MTDFRFRNRKRAFTLIELLVVVSIIALLIAILLPSLSKAREQARWAKCLANLHAMAIATTSYTTEYGGTLPGPLHPAMAREGHLLGTPAYPGTHEYDRRKNLPWLLRPFFSSRAGLGEESKTADEVARCPTAPLVTPDEEFTGIVPPYSYAVNSWGPQFLSVGQPEWVEDSWFQTDPPFYFGVWYYLDPEESGGLPYEEARFRGGMWKPKRIESIKFASAEYSVGDAWFRRVPQATRHGQKPRKVLGTFPSGGSGQPLPSAPFHLTNLARVRSTRNQASGTQGTLPKIAFKGKTNLSYFDGHATGYRGRWQERGEGGTVNPFWEYWGGPNPKP